MKRLLLSITLPIFAYVNLSFVCHYLQPDNIEISNVAVKTPSSDQVQLGYTYQQVVSILGNPTSSYTEYWEMSESNALIYVYNGAKFEFLNNKLESYELTNSNYLVGGTTAGGLFKVGDNLNAVATYLPNWSAKKIGNSLMGNITNSGQYTDKFIYIQFNPSTQTITNISIRTY